MDNYDIVHIKIVQLHPSKHCWPGNIHETSWLIAEQVLIFLCCMYLHLLRDKRTDIVVRLLVLLAVITESHESLNHRLFSIAQIKNLLYYRAAMNFKLSDTLKRRLSAAWDASEVIVISLAVALFVRFFIAQPFLVSGASMEPSFHNGNFLIVDELSYRFNEPERGDVIIFHYPGNEKEYFIKRIIGLPGETLTVNGNAVTISTNQGDLELREPYIKEDGRLPTSKTVTLGSDEYFVMGDNRGNSFDSRSWGPLSKDEIAGIARVRVFPFSQFGVVSSPTYASSTN
jgi:signal peptidase I